MSDAADRRIAELERELAQLRSGNISMQAHERQLLALQQRDLAHIELLRKQLVERDVYEAQQILPPEQATLIKHLATVERCIEHGRLEGYDLEDHWCVFCEGYMDDHTKDCAWLALQFDRKPAETMAMVEGWAWEENARRDRDRERARAMTPREPSINNMLGLSEWLKNAWPEQRIAPLSKDMVDAALYGLGAMRITPHPLVPPGHAYLISGLGEPERFAVSPSDVTPATNPATVTPDEAPQHPGLEGEPRRARGGEDDQEGVPPGDHRPPDGER